MLLIERERENNFTFQLDNKSNRMCHKWQLLIQVCEICGCIIVNHERQKQNMNHQMKIVLYTLTTSTRDVTCRRKEMQMLRHTKGFPWGPSAVCTATWGGVRVSDILNACGTRASAHGCYVHFG